MIYNTILIRSTFPDITLNRYHEPIPVNDQTLISKDEEIEDENTIDGVTHKIDCIPTEHEPGDGEDSDEESIKSVKFLPR